jgi:hypothetical protein
MALIAVAADKGAPGVTTTAVALGAVWPRPVLLAECDPSGGDLLYRLPAAGGARLDSRRGLLSLAVAARRGLQPGQVWEHAQKLHGGLDVLVGVAAAEQGAGLELLWDPVGRVLAALPQADVIADCGRLGVDGPVYDLLAQASSIALLSGASLAEVVRLRERAASVAAALQRRGRARVVTDVVIVADYKDFKTVIADVGHALEQSGAPARVVGGIAYEPKSAEQLRGEWSGRLDKSMFIRTARAIAADLAATLPVLAADSSQAGSSQPAAAVPPGRPATDAPRHPADAPRHPADASRHPADAPRHPADASRPSPGRQPYPATPARHPAAPADRNPAAEPHAPPPGRSGAGGKHAGVPAAPQPASEREPEETPRAELPEPAPDTAPGWPGRR